VYCNVISAYVLNRTAPYAEKIQFDVPKEETFDTDRIMIMDEMVHQDMEKLEDMVEPEEKWALGLLSCRDTSTVFYIPNFLIIFVQINKMLHYPSLLLLMKGNEAFFK
jgi:hypothetical protein